MLNFISFILKWFCWLMLRTFIQKRVVGDIFGSEESALLVSDVTTVSF
jgi:hypothetical protein